MLILVALSLYIIHPLYILRLDGVVGAILWASQKDA